MKTFTCGCRLNDSYTSPPFAISIHIALLHANGKKEDWYPARPKGAHPVSVYRNADGSVARIDDARQCVSYQCVSMYCTKVQTPLHF